MHPILVTKHNRGFNLNRGKGLIGRDVFAWAGISEETKGHIWEYRNQEVHALFLLTVSHAWRVI